MFSATCMRQVTTPAARFYSVPIIILISFRFFLLKIFMRIDIMMVDIAIMLAKLCLLGQVGGGSLTSTCTSRDDLSEPKIKRFYENYSNVTRRRANFRG